MRLNLQALYLSCRHRSSGRRGSHWCTHDNPFFDQNKIRVCCYHVTICKEHKKSKKRDSLSFVGSPLGSLGCHELPLLYFSPVSVATCFERIHFFAQFTNMSPFLPQSSLHLYEPEQSDCSHSERQRIRTKPKLVASLAEKTNNLYEGHSK